MGNIALFRLGSSTPDRLTDSTVSVEKELQSLVEANLDTFFGVTFLASEFSTGSVHGGRIDTLGIDENSVPVIVEYKRRLDENVINQGLYYFDWLVDHRGDYSELVRLKCGEQRAAEIDWQSPRVLCVAADFTRYDEHAVQQIDRAIELIKYRRYGDDLLLFEAVGREADVYTPTVESNEEKVESAIPSSPTHSNEAHEYKLGRLSEDARSLYDSVIQYLESFEEFTRRDNKQYVAFKRFKNFACVEVTPGAGTVTIYVKVDPDSVELEEGFTRDLRGIGHWGTGDLGITIKTPLDVERAKPLIDRSYEDN